MKTTKILGATTLAGALLFTGVNANAAQTVNDSNVRDYAKSAIGSKYTEAGAVTVGDYGDGVTDKDNGVKDNGDYYTVIFSGEEDNGIGSAKVYKDGHIEAQTPRDPDKVLSIDAPENAQTTNDNTQSQATDNNVSTQATDNTVTQDNTQTQSEAQALPETGETSNTTLVTMVAAVMLAAGSLLTFKRFSKDNK
ncbi:LPXTG cell wall anchor domain-containing protein [Staphylococcus pasteuri]|uniref:LPXTG cell wall anchor domain-containing protein n=1 Tax=Staphylococcus pasteuri TaxID=45972 RepID=UPI001E4683E5|nr:LPXTG cell wall anchor domain-containing protein [Staphylococcus pasteuri]MCE3022783.1 LPXTG cell wall anchor domain-containing protein [Staphylococcus pasteuri]